MTDENSVEVKDHDPPYHTPEDEPTYHTPEDDGIPPRVHDPRPGVPAAAAVHDPSSSSTSTTPPRRPPPSTSTPLSVSPKLNRIQAMQEIRRLQQVEATLRRVQQELHDVKEKLRSSELHNDTLEQELQKERELRRRVQEEHAGAGHSISSSAGGPGDPGEPVSPASRNPFSAHTASPGANAASFASATSAHDLETHR